MVKCEVEGCGMWLEQIHWGHLRTHGIDLSEYRKRFPEAETMSAEMRASCSVGGTVAGHGNLGNVFSPEVCDRISEGHKGIKCSEETKRKLSEANSGRVHSDETRKRMSEGRKGTRVSEETKNKIRTTLIKYYAEYPEAKVGLGFSPEAIRKGWERAKIATQTEEYSEKCRSRMLESWQDPSFARMMLEARQIKPNGPESALMSLLERMWPGRYGLNTSGEYLNLLWDWGYRGRYHPDIVRVDGVKVVIFSNGNYWHRDNLEGQYLRDFGKYGIGCLEIWADEAGDIIVDWPKIAEDLGAVEAEILGAIPLLVKMAKEKKGE